MKYLLNDGHLESTESYQEEKKLYLPLKANYPLKNFFFKHLFIFERQSKSEHKWGRHNEGTQIPKQAPGSELSAQGLMRGSNSRTARS